VAAGAGVGTGSMAIVAAVVDSIALDVRDVDETAVAVGAGVDAGTGVRTGVLIAVAAAVVDVKALDVEDVDVTAVAVAAGVRVAAGGVPVAVVVGKGKMVVPASGLPG